jgi:hypothetical protein
MITDAQNSVNLIAVWWVYARLCRAQMCCGQIAQTFAL